jgi:hypothetical protein
MIDTKLVSALSMAAALWVLPQDSFLLALDSEESSMTGRPRQVSES